MKKVFLFIFIVILLSACTLDNSVENTLHNSVGMITFDTSVSKGITASIEYPTLLDKTWTLSAQKLDGARTGEGQYEDIVLTDSLGPFSVGSWRFTITSSDGSITGSVDATIKAGNNTVAITVHSTATKGTLSFENCDFLESKAGHVLYVDLYVDEVRLNAPWTASDFITEDNNYYILPTFTTQLDAGIHTVRFYYGTDNGGFSSETISIRTVNGAVTHFTLGEQEGNLIVSVSFDVVEALV